MIEVRRYRQLGTLTQALIEADFIVEVWRECRGTYHALLTHHDESDTSYTGDGPSSLEAVRAAYLRRAAAKQELA